MTALAEIQGHTFFLPALGPDSIVLDLGASCGEFALEMQAMTCCDCYCAEASPSAFQVLEQHKTIETVLVAITGVDGPTSVYVGGCEGDKYWVMTQAGVVDNKSAQDVPGVTLKSFMAKCGIETADLIKVDIEGAELNMFEACSDELLSRVGQFSVEFHDFIDPSMLPRVQAIIQRLERFGFEAIVMTRNAHGGVLFFNRALLGIGAWDLFYMRSVEKYRRGLKRMFSRGLRKVV